MLPTAFKREKLSSFGASTRVLKSSVKTAARMTVVADAASVGADAGSILHEKTLIDALVPGRYLGPRPIPRIAAFGSRTLAGNVIF